MASQTATSAKDSRRLVFNDGSSNKFWHIELDGSSHTVHFGRVGTAGQTQTKDFGDDAAARKAYDKLVGEKLKKGYVDDGTASAAAPNARAPSAGAAATPVAKSAAPAKAPAKKAAGKKVSAAAEPGEAPAETRSETTAPPAPTAAAPNRAVVDVAAARAIALDPEDWFRAGFRTRPCLERGEPRPFDKDECVRRLAKLKTTTYGWDTRWQDLDLPPALSRAEAHFWLHAMTAFRDHDTSMQGFAAELAKQQFTGDIDVPLAHQAISGGPRRRSVPVEVARPLANLLAPEQFFELMTTPLDKSAAWGDGAILKGVLITGFTRHVLPYLTPQEIETLRQRIRKTWDPARQPAGNYDSLPIEFYLAARLGMHDEVLDVISRWPDDHFEKNAYVDVYQNPHWLVFGLGSPEQVENEWRRLRLKVRSPDDARGLLACTEFSCLDCIADAVIAETNKEQCEALLEVLTLVRAPEAAVPMLRCKLSAKAPGPARDWLEENIGHAVTGLIETAGGRGSLAEAAIDYFQGLKKKGHAAVIAEALRSAPPEAAAKVRAEVLEREEKVFEPLDAASTPKWLSEALAATGTVKRKSLPSWANPALLPPLVIGERRLSDDQMSAVLQLLAATPVTTRHPLLTALRDNVPRHARDAFAWKLFQAWQEDGFPPAGKWAMGAIGHIGDDGCVLKLTPLIRAWPGESQHARAVFGLDCLRAVGSNVALMQLSGIAQKLKFKGTKAKAEQFVEGIAKEKGLTRSELEDRVVPDCGLDENGRREFPFGPRSFSFVLAGDLKAMVRDADGKIRGDLPKPSGKDDEAVANASIAEWKLLKKQIKQVATIQAERLEKAMVAGRRWSRGDFETLLVKHPLMTHLVQKLIWGTYDKGGKLTATFRVTEERDYADAQENKFDLAGADKIGVVHPLELPDEQRNAWGQVLGDYEIITPFPQMGRKVYTLEPGEESQKELTRYKGLKVVAPTLVGILEKLGWTRGTAMDGGGFDEHSKQFPAADVTAVVNYEGAVSMGYIDPNELLTLETAYFCRGMRGPSGYGGDGKDKKVPLGDVSPVVISEVLSHMQVLKGKAK